ncbi:MAG TPA: ATP-binding cassette domain-containing protein [Cyclobacteriaceae bacterium]|nr:ATP-binding cassette domain-containing protein [Cyclobacteriaceae bacterium]
MRIIVKNLSKRFNREWIFKDFSYQFTSPNTYALVGPNGSGKSTLLQILWGQMLASQGSISYENEGRELPTDQVYKHIAIAAPYMDLIDEFTLIEMVRFHFKFKKTRNNLTIEEVVGLLELAPAKDKMISNFSSGMKQRLKLGLTFYSQADALFLDEPTTNLDRKSIEWYHRHREQLPDKTLVLIASNQEHEYPANAQKVDILTYKKGY